jgi:broad specificity phosphatase PhoE
MPPVDAKISRRVAIGPWSDGRKVDAEITFAMSSSSTRVEVSMIATHDVWLIRHGETEWTVSRRHTGLTDLPLTTAGEDQARALQNRLHAVCFERVFCSPLQRAARTCELSGCGSVAEVDQDLLEWNYGDYEGRKRPEILTDRPDWIVFRDGCPNGESSADIALRADRFLSRIQPIRGNVAVFSSGHFLRVLIARWLGLDPSAGGYLKVGTAALTVLGYDHNSTNEPVIRLLNERPRSML